MRLLALITFLFSATAFAEITINNVSGVSAFHNISATNTLLKIYGGLIDGVTNCSKSTYTTCNTCEGINFGYECNEKQIYDNLSVVINFTSSVSGNVFLTNSDYTQITHSAATVTSNVAATVEVKWKQLCALDADFTGCEVAAGKLSSSIMKLGVTSDGSLDSSDEYVDIAIRAYNPNVIKASTQCANINEKGLCDMVVQPGDGKVYLGTINKNTSSPFDITTDIDIEKVRIVFSTTTWDALSVSTNFKDFPVSGDELSGDAVTGLENDAVYLFAFANIDSAGNIGYFTDSAVYSALCGGITTSTDIRSLSEAAINACPFIARPGEIIGLLQEDLNCFISTAVFGSSYDHHVTTFRQFRNKFLLTSFIGRKFVQFYYKYGSRGSLLIKQYPILKTVTRYVLMPMWAFSWISVNYGLAIALLSLSLTLAGLILFYTKLFTKKGARA